MNNVEVKFEKFKFENMNFFVLAFAISGLTAVKSQLNQFSYGNPAQNFRDEPQRFDPAQRNLQDNLQRFDPAQRNRQDDPPWYRDQMSPRTPNTPRSVAPRNPADVLYPRPSFNTQQSQRDRNNGQNGKLSFHC